MASFLAVSQVSLLSRLANANSGAITGWTGLIRVDGESYIWMGDPLGLPMVNQTSFEYTSTRSIFKQTVNDAVQITVTFLSPITPNDYMRGSLTSSYMEVEVSSLDGNGHDVQLYTDISAGMETCL